MNLSTQFIGIPIKNPIIAGSSGLSNTVEGVKKLADNEAGAVILKSLFEEQIIKEGKAGIKNNLYEHPDAYDYISNYAKQESLDKYLYLIERSKQQVDIPVIASINCISVNEWMYFTRSIESAGADGLELNISFLPSDDNVTGYENEKIYFEITKKIRSIISIPIALKMSYYSSGLANLIKRLSWTEDINAFILFNRYYNPDIDINKLEFKSSNLLSNPEDLSVSLRWINLLSGLIETELVPSTGIHNADGVIKQILAGAHAVQVVSALYKHGPTYIKTMLAELKEWMLLHDYKSINDFFALLGKKRSENAMFERVQFMKYYGGIN